MVRRAVIALVGALALVLVPAAGAHAVEAASGTVTVTKVDAPIRVGPGWNYDLITSGQPGDTFAWECWVLGSDWGSIWLYGDYEPGKKGWIDQRTVSDCDVD